MITENFFDNGKLSLDANTENHTFFGGERCVFILHYYNADDVDVPYHCTFNGCEYTLFYGDKITIDWSDYVTGNGNGSVKLTTEDGDDVDCDYECKAGVRLTPFNANETLTEIPFRKGDFSFYFNLTGSFTSYAGGVLRRFVNDDLHKDYIVDQDIFAGGEFVVGDVEFVGNVFSEQYQPPFGLAVADGAKTTRVVELECDTEYRLLQWRGRFGAMKSWWFKVKSKGVTYDDRVELQDVENGFTTLKDSVLSYSLVCEQADYATQLYLSDIFCSGLVQVVDDAKRICRRWRHDGHWITVCKYENITTNVEVTTKSFDIERKRKDVAFSINYKNYNVL